MENETGASTAELLLIREIEEFLIYELGLLDERRFEDWVGLFTEDGYYWAPASQEQESPLESVSLFYDDVEMLKTRFARLRHPRVHSQIPPSRTSHMVSNVVIGPQSSGAGVVDVSARFQMLEYRPQHDQRTFGGRYDYTLKRSGAADFRIAAKKATILNCDDVHLPIAIPF
jgi:3-phenylpropionate/cinnamic acid dioxygenase small subunit